MALHNSRRIDMRENRAAVAGAAVAFRLSVDHETGVWPECDPEKRPDSACVCGSDDPGESSDSLSTTVCAGPLPRIAAGFGKY